MIAPRQGTCHALQAGSLRRTRVRRLLVAALIAGGLFGLLGSSGAHAAEFMKIAKRGHFYAAPENTIESTLAGVRIADIVEIDVQMSKDGVVLLMHDATLERTTTGTGSVSEHSFEELQQLDAGSYFGRLRKLNRRQLQMLDLRSYFGHWSHARIPSLRSVAELCLRYSVPLWIDVKQDDIGPQIRRVLDEVGMKLSETYMTSGYDERSDALVEALPGILMVRTGAIPESWDASFFEHWKSKGRLGFMAAFKEDGLTEAFVADARAQGMFVVSRFATSAEDIQRSVDAGAVGALTRNIERMASMLPMAGDVNGDHRVDGADLEVVRTNWHAAVAGGYVDGDFDGSGRVDQADLAVVMRKWGTSVHDDSSLPAVIAAFLLAAVVLAALLPSLRRSRGAEGT